MSMSSKQGGGSRASDEDGRTSVKVGEWTVVTPILLSIRCKELEKRRLTICRSGPCSPASHVDRSRL